MIKLTLTSITRTPRTSKDGKPFTSVSIKAKEYGEKFISGFGNKANENWKVGDEVEVAAVIEKPSTNKQGQPVVYLNFEMPKSGGATASPEVMKILTEIANRQVSIILKLDRILANQEPKNATRVAPVVSGTNIEYPQMTKAPSFEQADSEDIDSSLIPF